MGGRGEAAVWLGGRGEAVEGSLGSAALVVEEEEVDDCC